MTDLILKKTAETVLLLFGITLVSFAVIHLAPGSPVDAQAQFNPKMTAQAREKLTQLYGLDKPVLEQYGRWLSRLARLDFGDSFVDGEKVTAKVGRAVPVTLLINGLALLIIFGLGVPLGVWSAVRRGTGAERIVTLLALFGISVPSFWLALVLMSVFGVTLHILPVSGLFSVFHEDMGPGEGVADVARHLVLPLGVASLAGVAGVSRFMRSSMLGVLGENYIRTARAKGLSEGRVLYGHALPNAILPVITLLGLSVPGLLGGSVIFESIFSIPGMGRLFFNSVSSRDYPVVMGMLVLGAVLTLAGNLLADAAYGAADPRIRVK